MEPESLRTLKTHHTSIGLLSLRITVCEGEKNLRPSITHLVEVTTLGDLLLLADYNYATTTTQ